MSSPAPSDAEKLGPTRTPAFADARTHTSVAGADHTARIVVGLLEGLPESPWAYIITGAGLREADRGRVRRNGSHWSSRVAPEKSTGPWPSRVR